MKRFFVLFAICCISISFTGCESMDYKEAVSKYNAGLYDDAYTLFTQINGYKDSADYCEKIDLYKINTAVDETKPLSLSFGNSREFVENVLSKNGIPYQYEDDEDRQYSLTCYDAEDDTEVISLFKEYGFDTNRYECDSFGISFTFDEDTDMLVRISLWTQSYSDIEDWMDAVEHVSSTVEKISDIRFDCDDEWDEGDLVTFYNRYYTYESPDEGELGQECIEMYAAVPFLEDHVMYGNTVISLSYSVKDQSE